MIRPFGLNDLWLVRRLQRSGLPLAIEHVLTHPQQPLWIALTAPWPWAGTGVATYVLDGRGEDRGNTGFIQLMKRDARPEADLAHLAPAFGGDRDGAIVAIWCRLLNHCVTSAGNHGIQRIFASIPTDGPAMGCLKEVGFSLYARETIFRLARADAATGSPPPGLRGQRPQDSWALQRLYARGTPRLVQQAEGALSGEAGAPPLSWWEPDRWHGIVWEPAGEVRGAAQVHLGRAGHWLRIWGAHNLSARELRELIEQGLSLIASLQPRTGRTSFPVYATVRDYEIGVGGALTGFGFAPFTDRLRFVKHTVLAAREPLVLSLATMEQRGEVPVHSERMLPLTQRAEKTSETIGV